jgi:protein-S-isoprenylcysteine O-methyltransferase Ste14
MEPQPEPTQTTPGNIMKSLILPGIRNFLIAAIVLGLLLCLLAGTLEYWQGWVFAVLFSGLTNGQGIYLGIKDPELLERRKHVAAAGESKAERTFIVIALAANFAMIAFSALDHRFGWSRVPALVSVVGDALMLFSFFVYYLVFQENSYAASSIKTFEGQKVVSTGLYGLVRHPKYAGDLLLIFGTPLALGSWWGLAIIVLMFPALAWRILDEEQLLKKDLPGYAEYIQKVQYRLVPYLW